MGKWNRENNEALKSLEGAKSNEGVDSAGTSGLKPAPEAGSSITATPHPPARVPTTRSARRFANTSSRSKYVAAAWLSTVRMG